MSAHPGVHMNVWEIHAKLEEKGTSVGLTTLYRNLDRMVDEGLVNKYTIDGHGPACYEFIDRTGECGESYHCRCEICGKLIHLHCDEVAGLRDHMLKEHGFRLDPKRTVFYGVCPDCIAAERKKDPEKGEGGAE